MISAIVFDFDGVLADSEPLHLRASQEVLSTQGITLTREEYYAKYLGFDDEGVFSRVAEAHGRAIGSEEMRGLIGDKARIFDRLMDSDGMLYPGTAACVERMADAFPLGIASGALKHEILAILTRGGLQGRFRFIVAAGDTPAGKPAPDPYRLAASLHGFPPSACVAVEDSREGLASAKAAGLACIGITHSYSADALGLADLIVDSLDEITPALVRTLHRG